MKIAMVIVVLTCLALGLSAQSVNVLTPNGGENWAIGSDHTITWGSNNLSGNVKIGLFKGGTHLGNIVEHQNYQAGVSWHVGNPLLNGATYGAGTDYQIQVQSEVDWHWKDQSDTNFTISSPIVPGVIIPPIQGNPAASQVAGTNVALFMKPDFVILSVAYGNGMLRVQVKNQGGAFSGYLSLKIYFLGSAVSTSSAPSESQFFNGVKFLGNQEAELAMPLQWTWSRNNLVLVELTSGGGAAESDTQNNFWKGNI